ncbi:MAG TPA: hypothetical protein VLM38_06780 [Blastocatellia bacterium]|nr:hypothetical protein [Blastocatellia bacterium]
MVMWPQNANYIGGIACAIRDIRNQAMSIRNSAGVLIYRRIEEELFVLIVRSRGAVESEPWSIPKGEFDKEREDPRHAAVR